MTIPVSLYIRRAEILKQILEQEFNIHSCLTLRDIDHHVFIESTEFIP